MKKEIVCYFINKNLNGFVSITIHTRKGEYSACINKKGEGVVLDYISLNREEEPKYIKNNYKFDVTDLEKYKDTIIKDIITKEISWFSRSGTRIFCVKIDQETFNEKTYRTIIIK